MKIYEESCRNVKDYPYHHDELAELLVGRGRYEEAADLLLQGMDMTEDRMYGMEVLTKFPENEKRRLINEINLRASIHPERDYWDEYLELLTEP